MADIWFDLRFGELEMDDHGLISEKIKAHRSMVLSTTIDQKEDHITKDQTGELHKQLDLAVDSVNLSLSNGRLMKSGGRRLKK